MHVYVFSRRYRVRVRVTFCHRKDILNIFLHSFAVFFQLSFHLHHHCHHPLIGERHFSFVFFRVVHVAVIGRRRRFKRRRKRRRRRARRRRFYHIRETVFIRASSSSSKQRYSPCGTPRGGGAQKPKRYFSLSLSLSPKKTRAERVLKEENALCARLCRRNAQREREREKSAR